MAMGGTRGRARALAIIVGLSAVGGVAMTAPAAADDRTTTSLEVSGDDRTGLQALQTGDDEDVAEIRQEFVIDGETVTVGIVADADGTAPSDIVELTAQALEPYVDSEAARQQVDAAVEDLRDSGPEVVSSEVNRSAASKSSAAPSQPQALAAAATGNWWPAFVSNNSYGDNIGRYNTLKFKWSSTNLSNLKNSGSTTFEPDLVTYNYDGKRYLGSTIISWSSNMPNAYKDTGILDDPDETVYTIGSHDISTMKSGTTYMTWIRTGFGNASSDKAKVVWQRGHYTWGCPAGPALCIFSDKSQIVYAWDIFMPGNFTGVV